MRTAVIDRLKKAMVADGLAAVAVGSPENFAYLSGFVVPSQPLMRWRHAFAVVTVAGDTAVVCVDMEAATVRGQLPGVDVRVWREFSDDPMLALAQVLRDFGCAHERVGVESDYLSVGDHDRLSGHLPGLTLTPVQDRLARLRQVKDGHELNVLRRLARISDQAVSDAFAAGRVGGTEMDLASALTRSVYTQGAEQFKLMIVATGERSMLPNVGPTQRVLKPQDVCRVEIFSVIYGYHAGVCRTAVVEHASPEAQHVWNNLVECKHLLLDTIAPGVSTRAVWERFRSKFDELGMPSISFVGHGIGLHLHEEPYLADHCTQELEPGMVLGVEPLVYDTGHGFGMQLKDMVAVTDTGCELLSDVSATDELAVVG